MNNPINKKRSYLSIALCVLILLLAQCDEFSGTKKKQNNNTNQKSANTDTDGDGIFDNIDAFNDNKCLSVDADTDGFADSVHSHFSECATLTIPDTCVGMRADKGPHKHNIDGDGCSDAEDPDIDGDGFSNELDAFDEEKCFSIDADKDDVADTVHSHIPECSSVTVPDSCTGEGAEIGPHANDIDRDGCDESEDRFPDDPLEFSDMDNDNVGDNADKFDDDKCISVDADMDGIPDSVHSHILECSSRITPDHCTGEGAEIGPHANDIDNDGCDETEDSLS